MISSSITLVIPDENTKSGATIVLTYDENRAMITDTGAMEMMNLTDIIPITLKDYLLDMLKKEN